MMQVRIKKQSLILCSKLLEFVICYGIHVSNIVRWDNSVYILVSSFICYGALTSEFHPSELLCFSGARKESAF
jgi:hypothetical protein